MALLNALDNLLELSPAERLLLVEELWDSLAADPESVPISAEQRKELDRRLAAYHADPSSGSTWQEVKARLHRGS